MEGRKGQAVMDYLVNYGWAILIVIIVIAVLWAAGMFMESLPAECRPCFTYFSFMDYYEGTLVLRNGAERVNIEGVTGGEASGMYEPGQEIRVTGIATSGDVEVVITYRVARSGLQHTSTATIHN